MSSIQTNASGSESESNVSQHNLTENFKSDSDTKGKKRILIVNPGILFPIVGMSQIRAITQLKSLSRFFTIDLVLIGSNPEEINIHKAELQQYCREIHLLISPSKKNGLFSKLYYGMLTRFLYKTTGLPRDYQLFSSKIIQNSILKLIEKNDYKMVLAHYWRICKFFFKVPKEVIKCVDTHYIVEEIIEISNKGLYDSDSKNLTEKSLKFSQKMQMKIFESADVLIFNSQKQYDIMSKKLPLEKLIVTPNGQDIEQYVSFPLPEIENTILFYGALGNEFNGKAIKLILSEIFPKIKKIVPDIKIQFVGSNPPEWLKTQHNGTDFVVTGFVEDIRPFIAKSYLTLIPLTTGAGFRGRTVELMALGVPIIGTHNALDCVGFENEKEGFITDDTDKMVEYAVQLLKDQKLRQYISDNAKKLAINNYSTEATFGKLSSYLNKLLS